MLNEVKRIGSSVLYSSHSSLVGMPSMSFIKGHRLPLLMDIEGISVRHRRPLQYMSIVEQ